MSTISVNCHSCDKPLTVGANAKSVICKHCQSHFVVRHSSTATWTEPLSQDDQHIAQQAKQQYEMAVSRLDREWQQHPRVRQRIRSGERIDGTSSAVPRIMIVVAIAMAFWGSMSMPVGGIGLLIPAGVLAVLGYLRLRNENDFVALREDYHRRRHAIDWQQFLPPDHPEFNAARGHVHATDALAIGAALGASMTLQEAAEATEALSANIRANVPPSSTAEFAPSPDLPASSWEASIPGPDFAAAGGTIVNEPAISSMSVNAPDFSASMPSMDISISSPSMDMGGSVSVGGDM